MCISILKLNKHFGAASVLQELSFEVNEGDYFGLLGENGSGKSTLIGIMLGLIPPDRQSSVKVFGQEMSSSKAISVRRRIGVVGEAPQLRVERTVWSYMEFFAKLYRISDRKAKIVSRLEDVGLLDARTKPVRSLSRGMKQRLALARALLHDPDLLILDEPVNGLDPEGVRDVRDLLARERKRGRTIFLCSHLLSEIEKSCTKVAVIHSGRLLAIGPTAEIAQGNLEERFLQLTSAERDRLRGVAG